MPSLAQSRYLHCLEAALEARRPVTDSAMAKTCKMSRTTIWEWKHDPQFREWLRRELNQTSDDLWPLILRRHELLAIQGSVRSAEFIAKVRSLGVKGGGFTPENAGDVVQNYSVNALVQPVPAGTVNLLIPRPPSQVTGGGAP